MILIGITKTFCEVCFYVASAVASAVFCNLQSNLIRRDYSRCETSLFAFHNLQFCITFYYVKEKNGFFKQFYSKTVAECTLQNPMHIRSICYSSKIQFVTDSVRRKRQCAGPFCQLFVTCDMKGKYSTC